MDPCVDEAPVLAELTAASVTEPSGARARPRINLVLYFGALGARAAGRSSMVGRGASQSDPEAPAVSPVGEGAPEGLRARGHQWAELMARTFRIDVLACPRAAGGCGSSR